MNKLWLPLLLLLSLSTSGLGLACRLPSGEVLDHADLIARVHVTSLVEPTAPSLYRFVARATIIDRVRGPKVGETVGLRSEIGWICPNTAYAVSHDYFVYARLDDAGFFESVEPYSGLFPVGSGRSDSEYRMIGNIERKRLAGLHLWAFWSALIAYAGGSTAFFAAGFGSFYGSRRVIRQYSSRSSALAHQARLGTLVKK